MKKIIILIALLIATSLFAEDYKLQQGGIRRIDTGSFIPIYEGNSDYRDYLVWVAKGNTPKPEFTSEELAAKEAVTLAQQKKVTARASLKVLNVDGITTISQLKEALKLVKDSLDI